MGGLVSGSIPDPPVRLPPRAGVEKSTCQIAAKRLEIDKNVNRMNTFQSTFSCTEVLPWTILQLSPKPQMSERRLHTICAVVQQHDHHYGDDLVFLLSRIRFGSNNLYIFKHPQQADEFRRKKKNIQIFSYEDAQEEIAKNSGLDFSRGIWIDAVFARQISA